jgi:hypothetical protein
LDSETETSSGPARSGTGRGLIVAGVLLGLLALGGVGVAVAMPWIEDQVLERLTIEIDYATVSPEGDLRTILTGLPKEVSVSVNVVVTNKNFFDIELHEIEVEGYVNESRIAKSQPELPENPLVLPSGEPVSIAMKTTIPTRAAAAIPLDILRSGDIDLRVEIAATGEAFGVRVDKDIEIDGVDLRFQPTLKF